MALNAQSPVINFLVPDLHDQFHIGIADASYYPPNFTITDPTIEITPPAFVKKAIAYSPSQLTSFNSNDVGITCITDPINLTPLPDGIWTVRMSIAPNNQWNATKSFMRTTNIRRMFDIACLNAYEGCCGEPLDKQKQAYLDEIEYYIELATAAGNDCNSLVAMDLLRQANKMLKDFLDKKPNFFLNPGYYLSGY